MTKGCMTSRTMAQAFSHALDSAFMLDSDLDHLAQSIQEKYVYTFDPSLGSDLSLSSLVGSDTTTPASDEQAVREVRPGSSQLTDRRQKADGDHPGSGTRSSPGQNPRNRGTLEAERSPTRLGHREQRTKQPRQPAFGAPRSRGANHRKNLRRAIVHLRSP